MAEEGLGIDVGVDGEAEVHVGSPGKEAGQYSGVGGEGNRGWPVFGIEFGSLNRLVGVRRFFVGKGIRRG